MIRYGNTVTVDKGFYAGLKGKVIDQKLIGGGWFSKPEFLFLIEGRIKNSRVKEWIFLENIRTKDLLQ